MTGGVNTVLIGPLDGMEMVPHLSLVLIADWYLVPMTGGVNIVLIGPLDGMEMVPHLSLVLIADWFLVANDRRR